MVSTVIWESKKERRELKKSRQAYRTALTEQHWLKDVKRTPVKTLYCPLELSMLQQAASAAQDRPK